ncbi:MAG: dCMP deaminase family protein [Hyphomicrobiales bacterium]|nr:dCMP deaminase family protein [Hyphomicrobiales bacterium]
MDKWDARFMEVARLVAAWSKDPSTKCGAVIASTDRTIISTGFNGLPRGVEDREEILNDRELKYQCTIHAEENAILNAATRGVLRGCSIYIHPIPPCSNCAARIIQAGITRVVFRAGEIPDHWKKSMEIAKGMMSDAGLDVIVLETQV